jgi:tRNA pseudouridine55 synthase
LNILRRTAINGASGYLLLDKQAGLTSFESLFPVKKAFATGKVCHTGTLDKFACGLLIVLVGRAVKLASWFSACGKRYTGRIKFGEETDTLDPEGTVIVRAEPCTREALETAVPAFTGDILQAPPLYSAVHIDGERAHKLARRGAAVEMKKRPVTIYSIVLAGWEPADASRPVFADIEVHCSSGTYIRSLARDLALAAGTRARLETLTRTAVGGFSLTDAVPANAPPETLNAALRALDRPLFAALAIPVIEIDGITVRNFLQGKDLNALLNSSRFHDPVSPCENFHGTIQYPNAESYAVFGPGGFAGMVEKKNGRWNYGFVYDNG